MNCKPGDIARIVGGIPENFQKLVRVIERDYLVQLFLYHDQPTWAVEALQPLMTHFGEMQPAGAIGAITDACLRPLHDGDGADETLRIAGKPVEHSLAESDA